MIVVFSQKDDCFIAKENSTVIGKGKTALEAATEGQKALSSEIKPKRKRFKPSFA